MEKTRVSGDDDDGGLPSSRVVAERLRVDRRERRDLLLDDGTALHHLGGKRSRGMIKLRVEGPESDRSEANQVYNSVLQLRVDPTRNTLCV